MNGIKEVRARRNLKLPVDPLKIRTMGEYDFALLVFRCWFGIGPAGEIQPRIIESWSFDISTGVCQFKVSETARWSDGSQITSSDLRLNLFRAVQLGTAYGDSISAIVDLTQFLILDDLKFSLKTNSKELSDLFINRMASIFLAVVNPEDLDINSYIQSNHFSSGPFKVVSQMDDEITLRPNEHFPNHHSLAPQKIVFRSLSENFSISGFLKNESWENYVQLSTFLPQLDADDLMDSSLPFWTRSHDRVSLLRPGNGSGSLKMRANLIKAIGISFNQVSLAPELLKIKRASSLQPAGYPLHQNLKTQVLGLPLIEKQITILAVDGLTTEFHIEALESPLNSLGVTATWIQCSMEDFIARLNSDHNFDLALVSVGVADPEPSTWLSLLLDSHFIHVLPDEKDLFLEALKTTNRLLLEDKLKALLEAMYARGSYTPLFWGSTLSVVQKYMSLERISPTDETVDLAKILFVE